MAIFILALCITGAIPMNTRGSRNALKTWSTGRLTLASNQARSDITCRALEMEGTCTGEHGIGIVKKDYLLQELGPETIKVMKIIKRALDPDLLMNPVSRMSIDKSLLVLTT
jgi:hypothetical protein